MKDSRYERHFSSAEILQVTGLSERRFYYWIDQGYIGSKQPRGSGSRWAIPYIDVLKFDLAAVLTTNGIELMTAIAALASLHNNDLPFNNQHLTTTEDGGWIVTSNEPPNQLLQITINLTEAIQSLDKRIAKLQQGVLPF